MNHKRFYLTLAVLVILLSLAVVTAYTWQGTVSIDMTNEQKNAFQRKLNSMNITAQEFVNDTANREVKRYYKETLDKALVKEFNLFIKSATVSEKETAYQWIRNQNRR